MITSDQASEILRPWKDGMSVNALGKMFGVHYKQINKVTKGVPGGQAVATERDIARDLDARESDIQLILDQHQDQMP